MKIVKYVCETKWHEEVELKNFEPCPKCNSEAYHSSKFTLEEENDSKKEE